MQPQNHNKSVPIYLLPSLLYGILVLYGLTVNVESGFYNYLFGIIILLFTINTFSWLIKKQNNHYFKLVIEGKPHSKQEALETIKAHRKEIKKEYSVIVSLGCTLIFMHIVSLAIAYQVGSLLLTSFFLTNTIFLYSWINQKRQLASFHNRLYISQLPSK